MPAWCGQKTTAAESDKDSSRLARAAPLQQVSLSRIVAVRAPRRHCFSFLAPLLPPLRFPPLSARLSSDGPPLCSLPPVNGKICSGAASRASIARASRGASGQGERDKRPSLRGLALARPGPSVFTQQREWKFSASKFGISFPRVAYTGAPGERFKAPASCCSASSARPLRPTLGPAPPAPRSLARRMMDAVQMPAQRMRFCYACYAPPLLKKNCFATDTLAHDRATWRLSRKGFFPRGQYGGQAASATPPWHAAPSPRVPVRAPRRA